MMMCDEMVDIQTVKQAKAELDALIQGVTSNALLDGNGAEGSVLEQFRSGARASCEYALVGIVEKLSHVPDDEVARITQNRRRQKRFIRKYERIGARLKTIDAAVNFPKALAPLRDILIRIGADEDSYAFEAPREPMKQEDGDAARPTEDENAKKSPETVEPSTLSHIDPAFNGNSS
jgi:hypothetical protein